MTHVELPASHESALLIEDRYRSISRIARVAEWLSIASIIVIVAAIGYVWSDQQKLLSFLAQDVPGLIINAPSGGARVAAGMFGSIAPILLIAALWEARQLFRLFARRRIFDAEIPAILVRLGFLAIAAAVAGIVARTIIVLLLTVNNPPGQIQLSLGIGSQELLGLVAGLLLFAFSLITKETRRIADENESFV
jgi:hypothetical protein